MKTPITIMLLLSDDQMQQARVQSAKWPGDTLADWFEGVIEVGMDGVKVDWLQVRIGGIDPVSALLERYDIAMRDLMSARRQQAYRKSELAQANEAYGRAISRFQKESGDTSLSGELYYRATERERDAMHRAERDLLLADHVVEAVDAVVEKLFAERESGPAPLAENAPWAEATANGAGGAS